MRLTLCALVLLITSCLEASAAKGCSPLLGPASEAPQTGPIMSLIASQESGEVTGRNWQRHPKIRAVRAIVEGVKAGMSRRAFTVSTRRFDYCEPYEDALRRLAVDGGGRVRYYEKQAGSDDSALTWEHYYDEAGRLRFVFIKGGAANGARLEHRIYFDETGRRIREEQRYRTRMHYTFPETWPDEQLQLTDARSAFAAPSPCPEIKGSAGKRARRPKS